MERVSGYRAICIGSTGEWCRIVLENESEGYIAFPAGAVGACSKDENTPRHRNPTNHYHDAVTLHR